MFFRVLLVTLLLGATLLFRLSEYDILTSERRLEFLSLIVGTYSLTIVYIVLMRVIESAFDTFAYVQLTGDLLVSAVLVVLTGGMESLFLVLLPLCVLAGSVLLYRSGSLYTMLIATALIVLLVIQEILGWWRPEGPVADQRVLPVLLSGLTNVSAVFLVGMLAGYLSEQARTAGQRLMDASRDLEALKALNGHIITSIQSGLLTYTLDHRIIFFNPAAGVITGHKPESVLYAKATELFPGIEHHETTEELSRWEEQFRRPDGALLHVGYSLSPLRDGRGRHQGWILILQDLTRLRDMEESVRRSERFAGIGRMAAGIAHEIRNPLASMSGSIQILAASDHLDGTNQRLMKIVLRETDRLNELVNEFLEFARPTPPAFESTSIRQLLEEMILVFRYLHTEENESMITADVDVELVMEGDATVDADPRQLRQIFWNLLNNAIQAMPDGGAVRMVVSRRSRELEVKVIDEGMGIPIEKLNRIFDPFYSTKKGGTGLGLALVHRILDEHNGRVHVESEVGQGTHFSVILPNEQPKKRSELRGVSP